MPLLKRPLLRVRVIASRIVHPRAARERQRRETIPCWARERRVDLHTLPSNGDRQISVDVYEPVVRNSRRDGGAEQLTRVSPIQGVDTVDDDGLGIGKAPGEDAGEEQVLGGACTAVLAQHPLHCAITRAAIRQCPYGFNKVEQRNVKCGESVDEPRLERGRFGSLDTSPKPSSPRPKWFKAPGYTLGMACP
jgi:hypothetical protein